MSIRNSWNRIASALIVLSLAGGAGTAAVLVNCGPFTDVGTLICPFVLEIYYQGITAGTTSTTFSPNNNVTRGQMAVFLAASLDRSLQAGSRRAALDQWWSTDPRYTAARGGLGTTAVGALPELLKSDGEDVWVANFTDGTVSRVRAGSGNLLGTWTGANAALGVLCAMGRVFVTGHSVPGALYMIDPGQAPGAVTTVANLASDSAGITFGGSRIWTANNANGVSIITPGSSLPWSVTTVTAGFNNPEGILWDGGNIWVTDLAANTLMKLDSNGAVVQTVPVGSSPGYPVFDGRNIWVPNSIDNSVTVVRDSDGAVLTTLTGNGLNWPNAVSFDGERILVTNLVGDSVSLWKAADLTPMGNVSTGTGTAPAGACSDGINFWITLTGTNKLARF